MSFAAAAASLADTAALQRNQALNRETRAFTVSAFEKAGFTVAASQANFVMVTSGGMRRPTVRRPGAKASTSAGRFHR